MKYKKIKVGNFITYKNKIFDEDYKLKLLVGYVFSINTDSWFFNMEIKILNKNGKLIKKRISTMDTNWRLSTDKEKELLEEYIMESEI